MSKIADKKKARFEIMEAIYDFSGGDYSHQTNIYDLANKLKTDGDSEKELINNVHYLSKEELLKTDNMAGGIPDIIFITHAGVVEVEEVLSNPEKETKHFSSSVSITNNINSMVNSNLQQATTDSVQTSSYHLQSSQVSDLKSLLSNLKEQLTKEKLNLSESERSDVNAEVSTLESQLTSSKPKKTIMVESSQALFEILKGAAGSGVWELAKSISIIAAGIA